MVSVLGVGVGLPLEGGEGMDVEVGVVKGMAVNVGLPWEGGEGMVVEVGLPWEGGEGMDVGMGLPWVGEEETGVGHQTLALAVEWGPDASVCMYAEYNQFTL